MAYGLRNPITVTDGTGNTNVWPHSPPQPYVPLRLRPYDEPDDEPVSVVGMTGLSREDALAACAPVPKPKDLAYPRRLDRLSGSVFRIARSAGFGMGKSPPSGPRIVADIIPFNVNREAGVIDGVNQESVVEPGIIDMITDW